MTAGAGTLWFSEGALADLAAQVRRRLPHETGGLLVGYDDPSGAPVVTAVVGAGPRALHAAARFRPDARFQQERLAELYEQSGRTSRYLGDWHTHPNGVVAPSRRDRRVLRRISRTRAARVPRPVMVIAGPAPGRGDELLVAAWVLAGSTGRRVRASQMTVRSFT